MLKQNLKTKIVVKNLADYQQHIPLVANWLWQEFSKRHGRSLKEVIYRTEHSLTEKCPQTLIAFYGQQPVGTISLWHTDHPYRQDLGPWLSCLFVSKKYRNLGIGQILQQELIKTAKKAGFKKIYLISELKNYYEKTGWKFLETSLYTEGRTISIYQYKL
jgi:predicted N-acetyltransferase YhbS